MAYLPDKLSGVASKNGVIQCNLSITLKGGSEIDVGPIVWSMDVTECYEGMDYVFLKNEGKCSASFECFWECQCWWCRLKRWVKEARTRCHR